MGLPAPAITNVSGTFSITCTDTNADIYYTTDGSDPETSVTSQKYDSPFPSEGIVIVKAAARRDYYLNLNVSEYYSPNCSFIIQHQLNTDFYMVPGAVSNGNTTLNTTSLMQPVVTWRLQDAGFSDETQYYYFFNEQTNSYLYCASSGDPNLKTAAEFNGDADEYKFKLLKQDDGSYRIVPKARSTHWLNKGDANNQNAVNVVNINPDQVQNHWKMIPFRNGLNQRLRLRYRTVKPLLTTK